MSCIQVINMAMSDPLTASVLVGLAVQKFVESGAGELAKKFTTDAIAKIPELWHQIKNKLQGRSAKVDEALVKLESGDHSAIDTVTKNLDVVLDDEPEFANELKLLAQTIQAGKIQDNSTMTQNNSDNAKGWQTKVEGGTAYIGEIHIQHGQIPNS
jgi:predicted amino acid racemase